ncbi:hypothetical protein [Halobellus sp. GM3]|uniref:hypothetical protein n=1 Tax=Halobellus sp. GM3 TaxID=3458410 RepID=UPI00403DA655
MTRTAVRALLLTAGAAAAPIVAAGFALPRWTFATVGFGGYLVAVACVVAAGMTLCVADVTRAVERVLGP